MFSNFENQKAIEFCLLFHLRYRKRNKLYFKFCSSIYQKKIRNGTLGTLILGWYNTCIIYLHVIEARLKVTTVMFYFCHSKNISNITKDIFSSMSICCWKKLLVNKYKKQMCYKENLFFFLTSWKMAKFFLQKFVIFNTIVDSFLEEKQGTVELARRYVCKNLLNLDCQDSTRCGILQVAYKWRITYEVSPSHFLQNVW